MRSRPSSLCQVERNQVFMTSLRPMCLNSALVCLYGLMAVLPAPAQQNRPASPPPVQQQTPAPAPQPNSNNPFETVPQAEPPKPAQTPVQPQFEPPKPA